MRILVHLSDLHFGRVDQRLIAPLLTCVHGLAPHVVAVSGDLTQRARAAEFKEARHFLDQLPRPQVVVPGNHDVPLYNVLNRFFRPLSRYRRFINTDLEPSFVDDEIAVLGINTARSLTFKNGRINQEQVNSLRERLSALPARMAKVVVTHHPFDMPGDEGLYERVGRAEMALNVLAACGIDVLLSGHNHRSSVDSTDHPILAGYRALMVQAGTSTSTRSRGETNSFNVLRLGVNQIQVERFSWREDTGDFAPVSADRFQQGAQGWTRARS